MSKIEYFYRLIFNKHYPLEKLLIKGNSFNNQRIENWNDDLSEENIKDLRSFIKKSFTYDTDFMDIMKWVNNFLNSGVDQYSNDLLNFLYQNRKEISLLSKEAFIEWNKYLLKMDSAFTDAMYKVVKENVDECLEETKSKLEEEEILKLLKNYTSDGVIH
tara:strand:+ start:2941 stop:3420 length:480 start_codon:yes stop_codon:yes gene_type:complete